MGSKKRSARDKQKSAFMAGLADDGLGVADDIFVREDARRERQREERDAALRYKSCERKNRYDSRYEAEAVMADCAAHGRHGLTCYRCEYCGGWHLTSHGQA